MNGSNEAVKQSPHQAQLRNPKPMEGDYLTFLSGLEPFNKHADSEDGMRPRGRNVSFSEGGDECNLKILIVILLHLKMCEIRYFFTFLLFEISV